MTPRVLRLLREVLPRDARIVGDTGLTAQLLKRHFPVFAEDGFYSLYAMAAMGSGLPISLGVQRGRPDATVVSVIGDGGFLLHAGELSVASQAELPVITVVIKNGGYKQIFDRMDRWYGRIYGSVIDQPDCAALARSLGCDGYSPTSEEGIAEAVRQALSRRRPSVIEVSVAGDHLTDVMTREDVAWHDEAFRNVGQRWPFAREK